MIVRAACISECSAKALLKYTPHTALVVIFLSSIALQFYVLQPHCFMCCCCVVQVVTADYVVMATGMHVVPNVPVYKVSS